MNRETARRMGEEAGINWLTVMDSGDQLAAFATAVEQRLKQQIIKAIQGHEQEDRVIIEMRYGDTERSIALRECVEIVRLAGEPE